MEIRVSAFERGGEGRGGIRGDGTAARTAASKYAVRTRNHLPSIIHPKRSEINQSHFNRSDRSHQVRGKIR